MQSLVTEIDQQILHLSKKLEKTQSEKKKSTLREQIQRLQEEREAYELAHLIL
jgi:hypothetical protein